MSATTEERWLPVVGWEHGYEVSDRGRVRSIPRYTRRGAGLAWNPGRVLKVTYDGAGYARLGLSSAESVKTTLRVHVLVATAFLLRPPGAECVRHDNGDCTDNRVENLVWGTYGENNEDMTRHGTGRWSGRTACERKHLLIGANRRERKQGPCCVACARAASQKHYWRARGIEIDAAARSDEIYVEITGKVAV